MTKRNARLRRGSLRLALSLAVPAALVTLPKTASAQGWLADRRYQEGAGIRTGNLELHPGLGGEIGYDSNWFYRTYKEGTNLANGAPNDPPIEGGVLRITPSLRLSTLGAQRQQTTGQRSSQMIAFHGGVSGTYREFIGPEQLRDQRNVSANADARLDIAPNHPIGVGVFAGYQRIIQPSVLANPNLSFNRDNITAGAEVIGKPGGGSLDLRAGYKLYALLFEEANGTPYTQFTHEVSVRNRWKFRPRTALFHNTSLRFISYPNADRARNYLNNSTPLTTSIGLTGLVTDRFGALASVGYAASFFRNPAAPSSTQYDSVIGQAEGTFYLSRGQGDDEPGQATLLLSTISLGYVRNFQTSLLGNFYTSNKGYAKVVYFFGGRVLAQLRGYFDAQSYPAIFLNPGPGAGPVQVTDDFTNYRVGGNLFAEYRFSDSFGVNTTIDYSQTISDTQIPAGGIGGAGGPALLYDLSWRRLQAFLGVRWFL